MSFRLAAIGTCVAAGVFLFYTQAPARPNMQEEGDANVALDTVKPAALTSEDRFAMPNLRVGAAEVVRQLTGPDSANGTGRWNVHGTDLGHMFRHKGALYMVFGDTYGPGGGAWRSSAMARVADPLDSFSFAQMIEGPEGNARELIRSAKMPGFEWTVIPTNGISLGDRMVLHYMSVRMWASNGRWLVRKSGLAYSDDDGWTWQRSPTAVWPNGFGFEQVAFVDQGNLIYSFGIPEGRFGEVRLRRVERGAIFDPAAYRYWDGNAWVPDHRAAAAVVPAPAGELSVAWSEAHRRWLMMYLDEAKAAIVLRTATELVGPWGEPQTVAQASNYPGLYAPFIVPGDPLDDTVRFTMSRWKPLYNVFLMKAPLRSEAPVIAAVKDGASTETTSN